jgi:hypothetical protein
MQRLSLTSLKPFAIATVLLAVFVALAPPSAEAQWGRCWFYPDSTTDPYSDFCYGRGCYGRGNGCLFCIIVYSAGDGGEDSVESPAYGMPAASPAFSPTNRGTNQPVGLATGTGLPQPSLSEAA